MGEIKYDQYEKCTDVLYYLDRYTTLNFNTILGKKSKDGTRTIFHNEIMYDSTKYNNKSVINIKRNLNFYLSIENNYNSKKEFIMIRLKDMLNFKAKINKAYKWYTDVAFKGMYGFDEKTSKLYLMKKVEPIKIIGLAMDKYLELEPIVYGSNNHYTMGIRIYISSQEIFVDMNIDDFSGLKYLIDTLNMYQAAQSMLNYMGRPDFGTNLITVVHDGPITYVEDGVQTKVKRTIPKKNNKSSFFNRLDNL